MRSAWTIAMLLLLLTTGCSSGTTQPSTVVTTASPAATPSSQRSPSEEMAVQPRLDACALLTNEEVKSVQGEELKETKLTGTTGGGLSMSQCFFTLPTSNNSISLLVAEKGEGPAASDPEDSWRDRFHEADKDHERKREADKKKDEAEEEEGTLPQKVSGVGQEAYWVGSRVGGALYVLKGNAYLRLSVGGSGDQESKIRKSKILAQKALGRL
jgi:hypothetical protein